MSHSRRRMSDFVDTSTVTWNHLAHLVGAAAIAGWLPDDIRHILGPRCEALLHRAASLIPSSLPPGPVRTAWLQVSPPADPSLPREELTSWLDQLGRCGRFADAPIVSPADVSAATGASGHRGSGRDSDPQDKIRRKVEALLRKAESTEYEEEAQALVARAQALQQAHRLHVAGSEAHLSAEELGKRIISQRAYVHGPYINHKCVLLSAIANANGVCALLMDPRGIVVLIGTPEDTAHVADLFASLSRQCEYFLEYSPGARQAKQQRRTAPYRRSFRLSFAQRIAQLLQEANTTAAEDDTVGGTAAASDSAAVSTAQPATGAAINSPSSAVELLNRRAEAAELVTDQIFPGRRNMQMSSTDAHGYADGAKAAERSHLRGDSAGVETGRRALTA
ncbi:DUF2786 domain-containing protein [Corynebacterium lizhenjunii]|uniref:DUF2786 domain-containing protein n=1 Tax=Corynebacterium lizhenjunii TaxID=2709394 RepID=A0A7T0PAP1_9CORY|nr:DUF2786 domain-containing protein [Corynebacterium lizhenjunii]QPK78555.1 DUF2786 domain-containing protein [Corynebacterium lizhenjunii]